MKYIVSIIFFCVTIQSIGQAKVWMRFGDEALQEGDYYGASQFYLKAWSEDSLYKDLVYKIALAYKGYHYNSKAIEFFKRIELDKTLQIDHLDYLKLLQIFSLFYSINCCCYISYCLTTITLNFNSRNQITRGNSCRTKNRITCNNFI